MVVFPHTDRCFFAFRVSDTHSDGLYAVNVMPHKHLLEQTRDGLSCRSIFAKLLQDMNYLPRHVCAKVRQLHNSPIRPVCRK